MPYHRYHRCTPTMTTARWHHPCHRNDDDDDAVSSPPPLASRKDNNDATAPPCRRRRQRHGGTTTTIALLRQQQQRHDGTTTATTAPSPSSRDTNSGNDTTTCPRSYPHPHPPSRLVTPIAAMTRQRQQRAFPTFPCTQRVPSLTPIDDDDVRLALACALGGGTEVMVQRARLCVLCHHFWSLTSALPCSYLWVYPLGVRVQVQLWLPTPVGYPYSCLGNGRLSSTTFELAANGIVEVPDDEHIQRHVGTSPAWFNYITCIPLALSTCCGTFPLEKVALPSEKVALPLEKK